MRRVTAVPRPWRQLDAQATINAGKLLDAHKRSASQERTKTLGARAGRSEGETALRAAVVIDHRRRGAAQIVEIVHRLTDEVLAGRDPFTAAHVAGCELIWLSERWAA